MSVSLPKLATAVGLAFVVVGVGWGFVDVSTGFEYSFLSNNAGLFLLTLCAGIVLASAGIVWWTRPLARNKRLAVAAFVFLAGLGMIPIAATNVHGPTALLFPVAIGAWFTSLLLATGLLADPNGSSRSPRDR